jgi:glycosyltransferase involved in cell wall biosynthesis
VRILYYPPAGPDRLPMWRDIIVLISVRWLFDKTIFHYHAGGISDLYDQLPRWQRWLFRLAYFNADAAVRLAKQNPEDGRRLNAKRDYVIPYGIDDPCWDWQLWPTNGVGRESQLLRILYVGILSEPKGVMDLIDACHKLRTRGVNFQLEMMGRWGNEEFAEQVCDRVRRLNLEQRVTFLGELIGEEKFAAYHRADVLCHPTYFNAETFGIVLLEAMAHGLPVVSTRWRGIPSVVNDGETGFLVEPHDSDALAARLGQLAEDTQLRQQMGHAGRARFEREFTRKRHVGRMRRMLFETAGLKFDQQFEWESGELALQDRAGRYRSQADVEITTA